MHVCIRACMCLDVSVCICIHTYIHRYMTNYIYLAYLVGIVCMHVCACMCRAHPE